MTKLLTALFLFIIVTSCNRNIIGTYRHKICNVGPNCFILTFHKDNFFEYKYFQDILGSGTIKGNYFFHNDTIRLEPAKDTSEIVPYFRSYTSNDTNLSIKVFVWFANKEMPSLGGQVILNDSLKLKLDLDGRVQYEKIKVSRVKVILGMNETLRDSIFQINSNDNNIEIHTVEVPVMETWIPKVYIKKGKKIYPLQFEPEKVLLGKNDYLKKVQ
jgi:hypothetical protein